MQDQMFVCRDFPRPGETLKGESRTGAGGKGSNQAIAAGRLGVPTLFIGAVGRDAAGREARQFYRQEGLACRLVAKPGVATGVASIWVNRSGQNQIIIAPGANERLAAADVPASALRAAAILVTQWEGNLAATAALLSRARAAGVATLLNPAPFAPDFTASALDSVDILIPNETEFIGLAARTGRRLDERKLARLDGKTLHVLCRRLPVPTVVVTLGPRGCFISTRERWQFQAAHSGVRVVDTTGAGDAFCGGFAAGWVRHGGDVFAAARLANAVAALSVTKPGTGAAMPRARAVEALLRSADAPTLGVAGASGARA
jgi:ribokinase